MGDRTFHLVGLGCPKNRVDSEIVWAGMAACGLRAVDDPAEADVIVVNTCAFIRSAVEESLQTVLALATHRRSGRCSQLVVAGCLTSRYRQQLLAALPEVDLFIGPAEVGTLPTLLGTKPKRRLLAKPAASFLPRATTGRVNSLSAGAVYLKVSEGCSQHCSFCIIPKIRGPQRSRPLIDLVRDAENLTRLGAVEIILIAQDLSAWGRDLHNRPRLPDLVEAIASVAGVRWLRLMYLYPGRSLYRLLKVVANSSVILPYVDIPLQHIDAGILRRMRRGGNASSIRRLVARIRAELPGVAIRTTLMTGFPGESEEAFSQLLQFVEESRFERLGVFSFSPEEGSPACKLSGQVEAARAQKRQKELLARQQKIAYAYHRSLMGKTIEVLVEASTGTNRFSGRAWNQAPDVDGKTILHGHATVGDIVRMRVTQVGPYDLEGTIEGSLD
jgi:ribosomal protein S12 methylthiotransferase